MAWWHELFGEPDERREDRKESYGLVAIFGAILAALIGASILSSVYWDGRNTGTYLLIAIPVGMLFLQSILQLFVSLTIGIRGFMWVIVILVVGLLGLQAFRVLTGDLP